MAEAMPLFIKRFWTEYRPDPADPAKLREVDWVAYAPIGSVQKTLLTEAIFRLSAVQPMEGRAAQNPAVQMAHMRWNAIKPHYEAWKKGQEVTLEGTPLAAWNGVSKELADLLRMKGVRTVEEIAALTDTHKQTMGIQGLHDTIENAKRWLTAQDKGSVARALEQKDAEISSLKEQMEEMAKMVAELMNKAPDEPKKRGPKPKVEAEAAA